MVYLMERFAAVARARDVECQRGGSTAAQHSGSSTSKNTTREKQRRTQPCTNHACAPLENARQGRVATGCPARYQHSTLLRVSTLPSEQTPDKEHCDKTHRERRRRGGVERVIRVPSTYHRPSPYENQDEDSKGRQREAFLTQRDEDEEKRERAPDSKKSRGNQPALVTRPP